MFLNLGCAYDVFRGLRCLGNSFPRYPWMFHSCCSWCFPWINIHLSVLECALRKKLRANNWRRLESWVPGTPFVVSMRHHFTVGGASRLSLASNHCAPAGATKCTRADATLTLAPYDSLSLLNFWKIISILILNWIINFCLMIVVEQTSSNNNIINNLILRLRLSKILNWCLRFFMEI